MTSLFEDPPLWILLVAVVAAVVAVMRARRTDIQLGTSCAWMSSRHAAGPEEVRMDAESVTKATLKPADGTLAALRRSPRLPGTWDCPSAWPDRC
ncbi:hypothetical protein [Streptomyces sp. NRRL B-3229]|uniref:hypothetical protein n=1 Tax=Streptomyces sp. NRRL B-3229 TaxID=1463836 RepID=UPI0004BE713A|nr:hypothetical protein [Streptomyces sp. NRRL B-3229]